MAFRGLFVGIDRYASPSINYLTGAKRDMVALHALFTDTLGDGAILLTDDQGTKAAIEEQFSQLASSAEDDVVVVAFSGHGTETHELVTYDADVSDLANTCIPLDTLTEWFSRIPARRLLCILDCCFSGGMGAKVLKVQAVPRSLASTDSLLDQLSGEGRLIFTASTATEPAWEDTRLGHGLLTYYLLEALQGAEEVREAGKVPIYRLLQYVTQRVIGGAAVLGKSQHPTMRGQMDGELVLPRFVPGALYHKSFPERVRIPASPEIESLASYGFPPALIGAWAGSIPTLNQLQLDAINEFGVLDSEHLLVVAPTSSGKTMVGELAALKGALERKRAFFLLPLKALVNDKHRHFEATYGEFGLKTIRATGEISDDIPDLMRGRYDICLMTYEKFAGLVLVAPHILDQVGTIVVDEVQMIADPSRGANLEFILTLLRVRRERGSGPQLILLSAVIVDSNGLDRWLGARLLRREERPVPLDEGILLGDGTFRYVEPSGDEKSFPKYIQPQWRKGSSQDWVIPLVRRLVGEGKQVIVFRETRGETVGCARYLAETLGLPSAQETLDALPTADPSDASQALRGTLLGGVAFHNSNLDRDERLVIEEQFRATDTTLRVIVATTTLAMGVNTPASAVVVVGLQHPDGNPYSVAEYKNIVGRAGRLGLSERGTSYLLALTSQEEHYAWTRYVRGTPEDIHSRFLAEGTDPRSLIVRVLVAAQQLVRQELRSVLGAEDIIGFLEGSFGAFQQVQTNAGWRWDESQLRAALANLEQHKLVERDATGEYHLTPMGWLAGEGGIEVESVTRIVDALASLDPATINDPTLITATQLAVELDQVYFPLNKKSTQKEPQAWIFALNGQSVPPHVIRALQRSTGDLHGGTLRAKRAAACLLWVTDWPMSQIERTLTQFGGARDGASGAVRAVAARTCDVLPTVLRIAELLHPELDLSERRARLIARLEIGIPPSAAELGMQAGGRLARGDYQRLLKAGLCNIEALEAASDEQLLDCLGESRDRERKLLEIRRAVQAHREQERRQAEVLPTLPVYES